MKIWYRILSLVLVAIMCFSIVACGSSNNDDSGNINTDQAL